MGMYVAKIEGRLVPFAGPAGDKAGLYWDANTDFALDMFGPGQPVLLYHGRTPVGRLGTIERFETREDGLWAFADVDLPAELAAGLAAGRLAWSSATTPGAVRFNEDGYVPKWPIVEGSLVDVERAGACCGLTRVAYERGADSDLFHYVGDIVMATPIDTPADEGQPADEGVQKVIERVDDPGALSVSVVAGLLKEMGLSAPSPETEKVIERGEDPARVTESDKDKVTERAATPSIKVASPYDDVSLLGMSFWHQSRAVAGRPVTDEAFYRAVGDKFEKHFAREDVKPPERKFRRVFARDGKESYKLPLMVDDLIDADTYEAWAKYMPTMRANELMGSTVASFGDELVPTLLSSAVYHFFRQMAVVGDLYEQFDMPSDPFDYPVITSGPVFYSVGETRNQNNVALNVSLTPTSQVGTGKVTFDARKLAALTLVSEELYEDSGIDLATALAHQYVASFAEQFDFALINGDESNNNANISYVGAAPTGAAQKVLVTDGIRHFTPSADQAAVTTLAADSIITLQKLMGPRGIIGRDQSRLVCIVSPEIAFKLDALSDYSTMDNVGEHATLLRGQVGSWRGVPVVVSDQVLNGNATGKVEDGAGQNTKGMFLVTHRDLIKIGYRRKPMLDSAKIPGIDSRFIESSARFDIQRMEAGASAVGFNVTI